MRLTCLFIILSFHAMAQEDYLPKYRYDVSKITLREGVEMAYVDEGPRDAKTLLMVHGLGGYIKNWYPTIEGLKGEYRCIAVDLPGYGLSSVKDFDDDDYMDFFSESLIQFVDELKLNDVILLGHSMGGQVSIVTALKNPEWLSRLILAAPAGFETFTEQEGMLLKTATKAANLMAQSEEQIRSSHLINFTSMPPEGEELISDRIKVKAAPWFQDYAMVREKAIAGMLQHPVQNELKNIGVPTLVLFGANDMLIPNRYFHTNLTTVDVANIGKAIAKVEIRMIDNAGHMLQMDQSETFNQAIINYLKI